MSKRIVVGYALLAVGLLGAIFGARAFLSVVLAPPAAPSGVGAIAVAALGAGFGYLIYAGSGLIFVLPGALLARGHESAARKLVGAAVILLGVAPLALLLAAGRPQLGGETLLALGVPLLIYLAAGAVLVR